MKHPRQAIVTLALWLGAARVAPLVAFFAWTVPALAATLHIADGDTFTLDGEKVRIENIDAPEMHGKCVRSLDARRSHWDMCTAESDDSIIKLWD